MATQQVAIGRRGYRLLPALAVCAQLLYGCGFSDDRGRAEQHADEYFLAMRAGDVNGALSTYAPAFFQQTRRDTWSSQLRSIQSRFGPVESYERLSWNVSSRVGTGAGTYVTLVYAVTYQRGRGVERLLLFSPPDGRFGIIGHDLQFPDDPPLEAADAAST